jgi:hypothetical protein
VKFTTLGANEDVPALARRLYRPTTPEAQREAEQALLRANPRLADASARVAGAVLLVPDVAGAAPTSEARSEGELVVPILQAARDQLSAVAAALRGTVDERRGTVRATIDQINSAPLRRLVSEEPTFQATLDEVADQANAESAEIDELDALQQQAIDELGQDLDDLIRSVGGQPSPPPPSPPQPGPTQPGPTRPTPTQPGPVQPTPSQPTPTTPTPRPTQPTPTQPGPVQPAPTPPTPTQPTPTQPTPTPPRPTQPAPTQPTPTQPTPTQPTPTQPIPTQPTPPRPTQPAPTQPIPAQPTPTQPTPTRPIQPTPLQPGSTIATPAQPRSAPPGGSPAAPPSKQKRSKRPKR